MSRSEREFLMEYTIKNVSKFSDGEIQWSDEIVWRNLLWKLKISKLDGFLDVSVYCSQTSNTWIKDCEIFAVVDCKTLSDNGKTHENGGYFNIKPPTNMEDPVIDFEKFLNWDEMEKNFLIADSAKIVVFVNIMFTEQHPSFRILHTFKHLARFEENETQFSDSEECSGIAWRICVKKKEGYFGCFLQYESNPDTSFNRQVKALCNFRIKTKDNYERFNLGKLEFSKHTMQGIKKLIIWEELISNYLVNDSVTIEAVLEAYCVSVYQAFDNSMAKKFVLSHQFSDVSQIEEGESRFSRSEKRFSIPWRIELKRVSGFLEIHLYCGEENAPFDYTKIETDCWFNLVSTNGKNLMRQMSVVFYKNGDMRNLKKVIRWDDMMTDYVINDSFIIEARIELVKISEKEFTDIHWSFGPDAFLYERCFFITCNVNSVSRFQDGEKQWGNTELRYNIPWRIQAKRTLDFLEVFLFCDEDDNVSKKIIQTKCTFNLVATHGNNYRRTSELNFKKPGGQGISEFIEWNDMIESCLNPLEDSLIVEAHVRIRRSMSMKYINGFVELLLSCNKELIQNEVWSIKASFQLMLVGANGKKLTDYFEHTYEKPDSIGDSKVIRWEDMLEKYVVDGNVTVEARVNFTLLIEPQPEYSFILLHTVKKLSNVQEGEFHFSKTEKHCDAPWRISLKKEETCLLIYLHCDKLLSNDEHWSIQVEVQLVLMSETGKTLTDKVTHIFNEPEGIHWTKCLEWEDMERDFMVEDSVKIEARVKIVEPVEIDNEEIIGDFDNFEE